MALDGVNSFGLTKIQWDALSRKERNKLKWQSFKGNVLPALLGGSLGSALFSKDKEFRTLGKIVTAVAVTAGIGGIDPTTLESLKGSWNLLKSKGLNLLNLGSKGKLSTDQKAGLGLLADPKQIPSSLSFVGSNQAKITLDGKEENY